MARDGKPHVPDQGLWDDVAKGITPLQAKFRVKSKVLGKIAKPILRDPYHPQPVEIPTRFLHAPPPLASFDRRMAQKLSRGQAEPEATIDLHGDNLEIARIKLLHFLTGAQQRGQRLVLVITGKGASPYARHTLHGLTHFHTPEREGRLRREVPDWLHEAQFRAHVVGFQPAHPRHGGGGAFYVRLRRLAGGPQ